MDAVATAELRPPAALYGRQVSEGSEEPDKLSRVASADSLGESTLNDPRLLCEDRARHVLFSLRLRKDYLLYCFICFLLTAVACTSTVGQVLRLQRDGQALSAYQRRAWEVCLEAVIGVAVVAETVSALWLSGRRAFVRDCWCIFDAGVAALTLLDWVLQLARWALLAEGLLAADLPLLALRFVLQPCRMLTAVSMLRRVRKMQDGVVDVVFDVLQSSEDPEPAHGEHILSQALRADILAHLPAWCRFREWRLAYSQTVHGTSMLTFFRGQANCGANVLLLKNADGVVLGGFVPEGWRICPPGSPQYGTGDCFVFTSCDASDQETSRDEAEDLLKVEDGFHRRHPVFFHAKSGTEEVLLWGDGASLSMGGAITVRDDFRFGSTSACEAFGSPALVKGAPDFAIAAFECWQLV